MSKRKLTNVRRRQQDQVNKKALIWSAGIIAILIILMTVLIIWNH